MRWFSMSLSPGLIVKPARISRTQEEGGDTKQKSEAIKVVVFGGTVTEGASAKLDVSQDCFKWGTTDVNMVKKTQTWWSILERILTD